MKLSDIRKMAIRQQTRVRFHLGNGSECVVDEHGLARIPGLREIPSLNLEQELVPVSEFRLESALPSKTPVPVRTVSRAELEKLVSSQPFAAAAADEHDE